MYDFGTGNLISSTKNGITTYFQYDTHNRILKEIQPYDTTELPTKSYTYSFDGIAPEMEKVIQKTTSNNTLDVYYIYDGLANLVQIRSSGENGQVVKNIFYNSQGRVKEEQNPYFDNFSTTLSTPSSTENKTRYSYDALSRPIQTINPDGTTIRTTFQKGEINDYDANGNRHTYLLDAYDRILAVTEYNRDFYLRENETYNTTYSYNGADELTGIRDSKGNNFNFSMDSLGRKTTLNDPDLGIFLYSYDMANNLIRQTNDKGDVITLSYDSLNRLLQKNSTNQTLIFSYDKQYQGTLSNLSHESIMPSGENYTFTYEYDERMRIIKEIIHEGGDTSITGMTYDSMDRLLQSLQPNGLDLDNYYGQSGKLAKIRNFINQTNYNAFGNPLNRTYFNGKLAQQSYNSDNARLNRIQIEAIQNLQYFYDNTGNIVQLNDSANNRSYAMTYDNLDRLTNVSIGAFKWTYSFDSLGNVLKIVRNHSQTTFFKYDDSLPHAPYAVITEPTNLDVYRTTQNNDSNKTKIVQFYLVNDKNSTLNDGGWIAEFGDSNLVNSSQSFNLSTRENILVIVEHNYSRGGNYRVNLTGRASSVLSDRETLNLLFGAKAGSLTILRQNASQIITEFTAKNSLSQFSENWGWNCSNGVYSTQPFNMSADETIFIIMEHSYSTNDALLQCRVNSSDGNQSAILPLSHTGVKIEQYNSTLVDQDTLRVNFVIKNYYAPLQVNWNISAGNQMHQSTSPITLNQLQTTSISQEINFTGSGLKRIDLSIGSGNFSDTYTEYYPIKWITISDYFVTLKNATSRIFDFFIRNDNLGNATTTWNASEPTLQNMTNLVGNESLLVVIEENYGQGNKQVNIKVFNGTLRDDNLLDIFKIRQIEITQFQTLHESDRNAVVSVIVKNNVNPLNLSWKLNNSQSLITPNQTLELTSGEEKRKYIIGKEIKIRMLNALPISGGLYNHYEN